MDFLKQIAPTVATALLGPLGGAAVSAIGSILGVSDATQDKIASAIQAGQLTPEQVSQIKQLELKYQADEQERGFRYAELAFKDRDSARRANVDGKVQMPLFWLSIMLLCITLGTEVWVLFNGYPLHLSDIVVGRVLGLMDAIAMLTLSYWFGTSQSSAQKTSLLAAKS